MTIDDLTIDVPIDDIALGFEPDGTPKTVPAGKATGEAAAGTTGTDKAAAPNADGGKVSAQERKPRANRPTIAELNAARAQAEAKAREAAEAQAAAKAERARADTEARARVQAESQAFTNQDEALRQYHARVSGDLNQITSAIASTQTLAASAERELQAALADETATPGERATRITKAQRELARAEAELVQMQAGKSGVEHEVAIARAHLEESTRRAQAAAAGAADTQRATAAATTQPTQPTQQQVTPDQWIEGVRQRAGGKVADWLSQHKEFVTDDKLRTKLVAFADHYHLVDEKPMNTDEFISALNARFLPDANDAGEGDDTGDHDDVGGEPEVRVEAEPRRQPRATPAAPVSRSGYYSSRNPNGAKIRLSPQLASIAKELGMKPEQYALNALEEIKKGKLPKNFLDPDYQLPT